MVKGRKRTGDAAIYEVAATFRKRGLLLDDSVFSPGVHVWSLQTFQELQTHFVENLDESARSFDEKLADQLRPASDSAKQLFAELFCFHLLITSVVTPAKKQQLIDSVLALMTAPAAIPPSVVEVFGLGMVNPGTYFNTGRWAQLNFLILLGHRWKERPEQARREALEDPWEFKKIAEACVQSGTRTQFHATLHLLFPETFEAIVSEKHIGRILDRFGNLASAEDPDRRLQEIRAALTPRYGEDFDFYDERIRPLWEQGLDPWPELIHWAKKLLELDPGEREYKLTVESLLAPAVDAVFAGGSWQEPLLAALTSREHDLVRWPTADNLRRYLESATSHADELAEGLRALWTDDQGGIGPRVQALCDAIAPAVDGPGERTSVASFLLMGLDASRYPGSTRLSVGDGLGFCGSGS